MWYWPQHKATPRHGGHLHEDTNLHLVPGGGEARHRYIANLTKPTCAKQGYTVYTCEGCSNRYTGSYTNAMGHWCDLWTGDEGAAHSVDCLRCGYTKTVDCAEDYEATIAADDSVFDLCPVCGKTDVLQLMGV